MATTFTEDFDDLTDGTTVTTTNTSFDEATGTATFTTETTDAIGTACCLFTASSQQGLLRNLLGGTGDTRYLRFYLRVDTTNAFASIVALRADFTSRFRIGLTAGRVLQLYNGSTNVAATTALTAGQWYRVEWKAVNGAEQRLRLFTGPNLHGTVPDQEISGAATAGTFNNWVFGSLGSTTVNLAFDQFVADDTTWPGPWTMPVPSGSGMVTVDITLTGQGRRTQSGTGGLTVTAAPTGAGTRHPAGSGTLTVAAALSGAGSRHPAGTGTLTTTAALSGAGTRHPAGTGLLAVAAALTGTGATPTERPPVDATGWTGHAETTSYTGHAETTIWTGYAEVP